MYSGGLYQIDEYAYILVVIDRKRSRGVVLSAEKS